MTKSGPQKCLRCFKNTSLWRKQDTGGHSLLSLSCLNIFLKVGRATEILSVYLRPRRGTLSFVQPKLVRVCVPRKTPRWFHCRNKKPTPVTIHRGTLRRETTSRSFTSFRRHLHKTWRLSATVRGWNESGGLRVTSRCCRGSTDDLRQIYDDGLYDGRGLCRVSACASRQFRNVTLRRRSLVAKSCLPIHYLTCCVRLSRVAGVRTCGSAEPYRPFSLQTPQDGAPVFYIPANSKSKKSPL